MLQRTVVLFCCMYVTKCSPVSNFNLTQQYKDNVSVRKFQEYLRIDTSRAENLAEAVKFWERQAAELNLSFSVHSPAGSPICVISWPGKDTSMPSIMLNSHMDMVPVDADDWKYPPFSAHIDENGDIYARGAQDDKDIAIQYIEAIRRLKEGNVTLHRTIHLTMMPDEETGGFKGMQSFIGTDQFKALNVGFVLDEGIASVDDTLYATYLDRRPWQMKFTIFGDGGHGSSLANNTAMDKARKFIDIILSYRDKQMAIMEINPKDVSAYNSININIVNAGLASNVIPKKVTIVVDMRLSTTANVTKVNDIVHSWIASVDNSTTVEFLRQINESHPTSVDGSNPYWEAMQNTARDMGIKISPLVCPAVSDSIYLRAKGIPAIGFSPKSRTVLRIHENDEYLNAETFLRGVDIYFNLIKNLGNIQK